MKRWEALAVFSLVAVAGAVAQELDMTGEWQVYRVDRLAVYTLEEHASALMGVQLRPSTLTLNSDGTVESDVQGLTASAWQVSEGFLVLAGREDTVFFRPRQLR